MKYLQSDNGGKYSSKEFKSYCEENRIKRHYTIKMIPQQNGVSERMNRTLLEKARSMRLQSSLSVSFWGDTITLAYFLINRSLHYQLDGGLLEEDWTSKKVELGHLKVFGCSMYAHVEVAERNKLDPKSKKMFFIGYP